MRVISFKQREKQNIGPLWGEKKTKGGCYKSHGINQVVENVSHSFSAFNGATAIEPFLLSFCKLCQSMNLCPGKFYIHRYMITASNEFIRQSLGVTVIKEDFVEMVVVDLGFVEWAGIRLRCER